MTKLDQILLNGNNVALVCGHTLSLLAGEPAPIDPPCALAVGAGRQPKLRLGFGAVCGARDREEVLRLSPRSGLDALLDRILESDIDTVQPPQAPQVASLENHPTRIGRWDVQHGSCRSNVQRRRRRAHASCFVVFHRRPIGSYCRPEAWPGAK